MFGRVRRAVTAVPVDEQVRTCAVLHVYNPEAIAGVLAAGMGAAGFASGATIATAADGRQVSALADAVTGTMNWGRQEQRRYLRLPSRVIVLVTASAVIVHEWTLAKGIGRQVARWQNGTFSATKVRYAGQVGARLVLQSGEAAVMTGRRGPLHPSTRATVEAIVDAGQLSNG